MIAISPRLTVLAACFQRSVRFSNLLPLFVLLLLSGGAFAQVLSPFAVAPQGRLTLTSNTPVMTSDVVGATTVYYDAYVGSYLPIPGTSQSVSQISLLLEPTIQTAGNVYDIFAVNVTHGSVTNFYLCTGPEWGGGNTSRSLAIGQNGYGLWVNAASLTNCYNGSTNYGPQSASSALYLGSIYMTANGETSMQFNPAAAAGGAAPVLGLWNAYNRVRAVSTESDSNSTWLDSGSTTWRAADSAAGTGNRITWLAGLQQMTVTGRYQTLWAPGSNSAVGQIGVNLDSDVGAPFPVSAQTATTTGGNQTLNASASFSPQLGLHYIQAMEAPSGSTPTATFYGGAFFALTLETEY